MAFFSKKTKDAKSENVPVPTKSVASIATFQDRAVDTLRNPRITEKATDMRGHGAYVFDVAPLANKRLVASAVKRAYGVTPKVVRVVRVPAKIRRSSRTGKLGVTTGGKKAYVYLRDGDSITIT